MSLKDAIEETPQEALNQLFSGAARARHGGNPRRHGLACWGLPAPFNHHLTNLLSSFCWAPLPPAYREKKNILQVFACVFELV
jgi:hypothetical protein